jgi:hypothetical protein
LRRTEWHAGRASMLNGHRLLCGGYDPKVKRDGNWEVAELPRWICGNRVETDGESAVGCVEDSESCNAVWARRRVGH